MISKFLNKPIQNYAYNIHNINEAKEIFKKSTGYKLDGSNVQICIIDTGIYKHSLIKSNCLI